MCFSSPSVNIPPAPPPPVVDTEKEDEVRRRFSDDDELKKKLARSRGGTIHTSPLGVQGLAQVSQTSLLGQ